MPNRKAIAVTIEEWFKLFWLSCVGFMKKFVQSVLQKLLGFRRYLVLFSWFKIKTLRRDKKEGDFFFFLELLPADATVLDIGANIGIMTVHLAKKCVAGHVHAIEPIPENFSTLQSISKRFHLTNVSLHNYALGVEPGELKMVMPEVENVKMQGLSHAVHDSITEYNEGQFYTVPMHTLDGLRKDFGMVKGIKIDVENFEYFVFKGGENLLREDRPIVYCELWDNENRDNCFDLFRQLGFSIQVLSNGKLENYDPNRHQNQNFFFVPGDR